MQYWCSPQRGNYHRLIVEPVWILNHFLLLSKGLLCFKKNKKSFKVCFGFCTIENKNKNKNLVFWMFRVKLCREKVSYMFRFFGSSDAEDLFFRIRTLLPLLTKSFSLYRDTPKNPNRAWVRDKAYSKIKNILLFNRG